MKQPVRRVLASVTDKTGLAAFLKALPELEIISTGGTASCLSDAGLTVTAIEDVTGFPECFDGRVKTLHPAIHGGILFRRDVHAAQAEQLGIQPIDMVICNLYDFAGHLDIEHMDIGGSTLIRAATKNYAHVAIVVDPSDYAGLQKEILETGGLSAGTRQRLAVKAINASADYEALLATELTRQLAGEQTQRPKLVGGTELRYGENPDQEAWVYRFDNGKGIATADVLAGKAPSYNNYEDATAAYRAVQELLHLGCAHGAAVVKHGSLCGYATSKSLGDAFGKAWDGDNKSAFGSVIALTSPVDLSLSETLQGKFIEVLIAPSFDAAFVAWAKEKRPNLRLLALAMDGQEPQQYSTISGGMLIQTPQGVTSIDLTKVATKLKPPEQRKGLFRFALAAVKFAKSNAIVIAHEPETGCYQLIGVGSGQPNRVDSLQRLAVPKALDNLRALYDTEDLSQCVMASDGFFPFADSVEYAASVGISYCAQPGGSKRDPEVIAAADEHHMCMLMTGERYFSH